MNPSKGNETRASCSKKQGDGNDGSARLQYETMRYDVEKEKETSGGGKEWKGKSKQAKQDMVR